MVFQGSESLGQAGEYLGQDCGFPRSPAGIRRILEDFGRILKDFGRISKDLGGFRKISEDFRRFWRISASRQAASLLNPIVLLLISLFSVISHDICQLAGWSAREVKSMIFRHKTGGDINKSAKM